MLKPLSSASWNPTDQSVPLPKSDSVFTTLPTAVIITAAGVSSRMDSGAKKELRLVDGVPVIRKCLQAFVESKSFDHLVITYPVDGRPEMEKAVKELEVNVLWVLGGATRQESIFNALEELAAVAPAIVLIHDGARPWVGRALILSVLTGAAEHGACVPVVPLTDAPKRLAANGAVSEHLDKTTLVNVQTPQGFRFAEIYQAHRVARSTGNDYSDDAETYHHAIGRVFSVKGEPSNRKITYGYHLG